MEPQSIPLEGVSSPRNDREETEARPSQAATPPPPTRSSIPILSLDRQGRFSYYLEPALAFETSQAWWRRLRASRAHGFIKKAGFFIAMRRDCVKIATITFVSPKI